MTKTVRTRFAPSPTGYLHIGGVRTALFNYLFAKQHGGEFILRIDDTDQQRNVEAALEPILHGLKWLGINWDNEELYYQSKRTYKYADAVEKLIESGHAYWDYATPDEIQAEREVAQAAKQTFVYSRSWMATTLEQAKHFESEGRTSTVRLKMPREGKCVINDLVRGTVEFNWADEQDHIIVRSNGDYTYHLASVVDDHDLGITHVIRAEEHLSNTPRQIFIAQALGYELPEYAHLPCVAEPGSKVKLSKRKLDKYLKNKAFADMYQHGISIMQRLGKEVTAESFNPVITDFYEKCGYLPEAIVNYIALLGWSLDDKTEMFTMDELIKSFSLDGVSKGAASFDPQKLMSFQQKWMAEMTLDEKVFLCGVFLDRTVFPNGMEYSDMKLTEKVIEAAGDRIKVAGDILDYTYFFKNPELDIDKFKKSTDQATQLWLDALRNSIEMTDECSFDGKSIMDQYVTRNMNSPLRIALTGSSVGVSMSDTLDILGKNEVIKRIGAVL